MKSKVETLANRMASLAYKTAEAHWAEIAKIEAKMETLFYEQTERGKELEKIRGLILGWQEQIPKPLLEKLTLIIKGYEQWCTK